MTIIPSQSLFESFFQDEQKLFDCSKVETILKVEDWFETAVWYVPYDMVHTHFENYVIINKITSFAKCIQTDSQIQYY